MKRLFVLPGFLLAFIAVTSCGGSKQTDSAEHEIAALSVDSVLADPDSFVGDTVTVEGVCSHLCKHGGRKAFLLGTGDTALLRCEATESMGGAFPQESIHKPLRIIGVVHEERIDESTLLMMEQARADQVAQLAEQMDADQLANAAAAPGGCDTERAAAGQADIATFEARMADYRERIAARDFAEGKPYLSQYFIETISFEILPE